MVTEQVSRSADSGSTDDEPTPSQEVRALLKSLVGQPITMPGGGGRPFRVEEIDGSTVRIDNGVNLISIPLRWFTGSWSRLKSSGKLSRGTMPADAKYRSGYVFGVLAQHGDVSIVKAMPTKLEYIG